VLFLSMGFLTFLKRDIQILHFYNLKIKYFYP
jgi:hypothetical protein